MEFKALLFAGIAFFFFVVFIVVGGFFLYDANERIEEWQKQVDTFEDLDGDNHHWYDAEWPEGSGVNHTHPEYLNAVEESDSAKDSRSFTTVWFVIAVMMLLVALALVAIHFIMEKRSDDKMGASFFMDGGDSGPGPAEENKRD